MRYIKILFFLFTLLFSNMIILSAKNYSYYDRHTDLKLYFSTGINYHFPLTTDITTINSELTFDVPLNINIDIRKNEYVSFLTGLELAYGIKYQNINLKEENYISNFHSLIIRIPFIAKFYFMYDKDPAFENFYLELGGFLYAQPLNFYQTTTPDNFTHSGYSYAPRHSESYPGNIYTPANIGIKFGIGNNFYLTPKTLFGVELFATYLAIPSLNGYYFNVNYKRGSAVVMDFDLSVGAAFSIGIDLTE